MRSRVVAAMMAAAVLAGGSAAPAAADDRAVVGAWISEDRAFERLGPKLTASLQRWEDRDYESSAPTLSVVRSLDRATRRVRTRVRRARASSAPGRSARRAVLRSLHHTLVVNRALSGLIRAVTADNDGAARVYARRIDRGDAAVRRETARAVRFFDQIFPPEEDDGAAPTPTPAPPAQGSPPPPPRPQQPPAQGSPPSGGSAPPSGSDGAPPPAEEEEEQPGPALPDLGDLLP